ncbi:MAG: hypothetical protein G01um101444_482 [Parcubacteria group bacterium Gr01-1014_44]|nr:MAG: hypothetical protein G01um101444_482 [Parcubacteria group bacterium Gr01-1014_44]
MAVSVISSKPAASVVKKCICKNCGKKLKYVPKDVVTQNAEDFYMCGTGGMKWITCPSCKERVVLKRW